MTCQLGLRFVPDVDQAMQEFVRVLKPGVLLVASVWANQACLSTAASPFFLTCARTCRKPGTCGNWLG